MNSTRTTVTVEKLRVMFAQFGIPEVVVSDNGTNFVSKEFEEFTGLSISYQLLHTHHQTDLPRMPLRLLKVEYLD